MLLDDHAVLADGRAALHRGVEPERLPEPVPEPLVLVAAVDVPLDGQRLEAHLGRGELEHVQRATVRLFDGVQLALAQPGHLADTRALELVDHQDELVGPEALEEVVDPGHDYASLAVPPLGCWPTMITMVSAGREG